MKWKHMAALGVALAVLPVSVPAQNFVNRTDSVYLFSYATVQDAGRSGLQFAWSRDARQWFRIGGGYVRCDYGTWGAEKRMIKPHLMRAADGMWHCVWQLNDKGLEMGHAASVDLLSWKRQTYFLKGQTEGEQSAPDFISLNKEKKVSALVDGALYEGYMQKVAWPEVDRMLEYAGYRADKGRLDAECTAQDAERFSGLKDVNMQLDVRPGDAYPISDKLIGVFFEDINYGADGGLYAELVQNRDFEYSAADQSRERWDGSYAWSVQGNGGRFSVVEGDDPVHPNNPHYAVFDVQTPGVMLKNGGFDGIVLKKGEKYDFSLFGRIPSGYKGGKVDVLLLDKEGRKVGGTSVRITSDRWKRQKAVLKAEADVSEASLALVPQTAGKYEFDVVSLFPQKTFKGRTNGLRADLAQAIADLHPRFMRFPGGCVAHGDGIDNIYDWKGSVGPLEARKPLRNLWGYHQTRGLGYFEYFQFCEDMGAEPVPVLAAGVPCQNSAYEQDKLLSGGQQGGIPMEQMDAYVQDVLDLVEYANGDPKTSKWAKMRADAGHPEPFNLKYIGIGNEDLITDVFEARFSKIFKAVSEKYPDITVIGTVGPFYEGTDYEEGWDLATRLKVPMVDEHYYNTPGWFVNNQDFYDRYNRSGSKVYLGEYAAHLPGRPNNIETALSEALYLTSVERNGDVVTMSSYAPLLAKEGHTQWNPDLIYFNNGEVKPTVGYYTQLLFGQNSGDTYLPSDRTTDNNRTDVNRRIATSVIRDSRSGDVIIKLVNLLPVAVKTEINCPGLPEGEAVLNVLKGDPSDKTARPVEQTLRVGERFGYELPAYSLSVIRVVGSAPSVR